MDLYFACTAALACTWGYACAQLDGKAHEVGQVGPPIAWAVLTMGAFARMVGGY
jgi:hypothetical protein